jgi:predicted ester cyclase
MEHRVHDLVYGPGAVDDRRADFWVAGDTVTESWVFQGTHTGDFLGIPATGKQLQVRGIEIWRLQDSKIVERWGVVDATGVMEQLAS